MTIETIKNFAQRIGRIQKTDRWVFIVCDGDMGEGKSCFTDTLANETGKVTGNKFDLENNMTYKRDELKTWLDGDKKGKGRKDEYSTVLADELISMFFKRNWFDSKQIDGIELLNKCRDRHLCVLGNVPSFYDLDSAVYSFTTFRVHIFERGRAWVFQKDRNPFATDKWHMRENEKIFRKNRNPYRCIGFVCEISFPDWTPQRKKKYYEIRNLKRINTEGQREKVERYTKIKGQRDTLIRFIFKLDKKLTNRVVAEMIDMDNSSIKYIREGLR